MRKFFISISIYTLLLVKTQVGFAQLRIPNLGEKIPDLNLKVLESGKQQQIKLSKYSNKLMIIDFWATWCAPCVAAFPRHDSLQRKLKDVLQIIPVSKETEEVVQPFLTRLKKHKGVSTFSVIADQQLNSLFPHQEIPYYVWIDRDGSFLAFTDETQVNEKNVKLALEGNSSFIKNKPTQSKIVKTGEPVFIIKPQLKLQRQDTLYFRDDSVATSIITGYNSNLNSGVMYQPSRIIAHNTSINNLFRRAFGNQQSEFLTNKRIISEIKDSVKAAFALIEPKNTYQGLFNYEVILKSNNKTDSLDGKSTQALKVMREDLNTYFKKYGLQAKREQRLVKTFELQRIIGSKDLSAAVGEERKIIRNKFSFVGKNIYMLEFVSALEYYWQLKKQPPIRDKTGFGKVNISLEGDLTDVELVKNQLKANGLMLVEKEEALEMIIIYEVPVN